MVSAGPQRKVVTCNLLRSSLNKPSRAEHRRRTMAANKNNRRSCEHLDRRVVIKGNTTPHPAVLSEPETHPVPASKHRDQTRLAGKRLCADTFWSEDGTVPEMEASYLVRVESKLP